MSHSFTGVPRAMTFMPMLQDARSRAGYSAAILIALVGTGAVAPAAARAQPPPAPTGLAVSGTSASATISWLPVNGAVSYSVKRWRQDDLTCCSNSVAGLRSAAWVDSAGFPKPGTYVFEVTAKLKGTSSVGLINWTVQAVSTPPRVDRPSTPSASPSVSIARSAVKTALRASPAVGIPTVNVPLSGPAPQNVRMLPGGPVIHYLVWDRTPESAGYTVFRNTAATRGEWIAANSTLLTTEKFQDTNIVQPGSKYRVTAVYADGRQGSTDFIYANPPQMRVPGMIYVWHPAPRDVWLYWDPMQFAEGYRVMGSGRPTDGTYVDATTLRNFNGAYLQSYLHLENLADGAYSWRVTADYGGAYQTAGMPTASVTVVTPVALSPRFRVSILGFKAIVETADDLLSRDGRNNEVYAAAMVCQTIGLASNTPIPCALVRSAVHGDTNGFSGRVKAGSGSSSGGITSGDLVGAGPSGTTAGSTSTFPFLLWEGTLLGDKTVWLAPSLWERGGNDKELYEWSKRFEGSTRLPFTQEFAPYQMSPYPCVYNKGNDRPIGFVPPSYAGDAGDRLFGIGQGPGFMCSVIGLNLRKAEWLFAAPPQEAGHPVGVLTIDLPDAVSGHYVMWLKLERLP